MGGDQVYGHHTLVTILLISWSLEVEDMVK